VHQAIGCSASGKFFLAAPAAIARIFSGGGADNSLTMRRVPLVLVGHTTHDAKQPSEPWLKKTIICWTFWWTSAS
jgi:hypothetical protein